MSEPTILVVDPSETFQTMLTTMLEKRGYQARSTGSVPEATNILRSEPVNMVLTEIDLDGMSGLNLLKTIKDDFPDVEVVVVSSNSSSYVAIKALRLGAYDFIVKPIDDEAMFAKVVERTLERQALAIENRKLIFDLSAKNRELLSTLNLMKALNKSCAIISSTLDIGDILRLLVENAVEQLDASKGYLLLLDKKGENFTLKAGNGIDHQLVRTFKLRYNQGISGLVAAFNKPLAIGTEIPPSLSKRIQEEDAAGVLFAAPGILSVPLHMEKKVIGVVTISGRKDDDPFSDAEVEFLTTLANHAAIALANAGTFYKLKKSNA